VNQGKVRELLLGRLEHAPACTPPFAINGPCRNAASDWISMDEFTRKGLAGESTGFAQYCPGIFFAIFPLALARNLRMILHHVA
jgi:hypothetical protein